MSNPHDFKYLMLAEEILGGGINKGDRTGTGTRSSFGDQLKFDLSRSFPLLTSKKLFWKAIVVELLWMLSGSTNVKDLQAQGISIWDEWAKENGELGPVYGAQWRNWQRNRNAYIKGYRWKGAQAIDQIAELIEGMKRDPNGRRHIVTAWNPAELHLMSLPPCHCFFQCYVRPGDAPDMAGYPDYSPPTLDLMLYQRSADLFLGVPFNIASYALLTMMLAQVCGFQPGTLIHNFGDVHIYKNHFPQMQEQIGRVPPPSPRVILNSAIDSIDGFSYSDITLEGYAPLPAIKGSVSV